MSFASALDDGVVVGDGETALVPADPPFALADLGIEDDHRIAPDFLVAPLRVDHEQPQAHADLRRRESDPRLVVHDLDHVGGELADLVRDLE